MIKVKSNKGTLYAICILIMLFLIMNNNLGHIVEEELFESFQKDSESLVVGKLWQSSHFGVMSNFGLLSNYQNKAWTSKKNIIYDAYKENIIPQNKDFVNYVSQIGLQGMVFSLIDKVTPFSNQGNIVVFNAINVILLSIMLLIFLYWVYKEFNLWVSFITLIGIIFSPWLLIFGRNLYWVSWTWFLPMMLSILFLDYEKKTGKYSNKVVSIGIALAIFIKCANGYEYISTILVSLTIPFFFYAISYKWNLKKFVNRFKFVSCSAIIGFLSTLLLHLFQLSFVTGSLHESIEMVSMTALKRTYADPTTVPEIYRASLEAPIISVIDKYWNGIAIDLSRVFGLPNVSLFSITFQELINLFIIFTVLCFISEKYAPSIANHRRKLISIAVCTWISILSPISWFVLAKGHSYIHTHINFVLWYLPFALFGFILIGAVSCFLISDLRKIRAIRYFGSLPGRKKRLIIAIVALLCLITIFVLFNLSDSKYLVNDNEISSLFDGEVIVKVDDDIDIGFYGDSIYYLVKSDYLNKNHRFYLHIYPKELSNIGDNRKQYGYNNSDFQYMDKEIKLSYRSKYKNYRIAKTQLPIYDIEKIVTGQYSRKTRFWEREVSCNDVYSKILSRNIKPANLSDKNWENGVLITDNIILFDYFWPNYELISRSHYIELVDGTTRKIVRVSRPANQWIHVKYEGNKIGSDMGYPNRIKFKE